MISKQFGSIVPTAKLSRGLLVNHRFCMTLENSLYGCGGHCPSLEKRVNLPREMEPCLLAMSLAGQLSRHLDG